jgi:hypothetical protein
LNRGWTNSVNNRNRLSKDSAHSGVADISQGSVCQAANSRVNPSSETTFVLRFETPEIAGLLSTLVDLETEIGSEFDRHGTIKIEAFVDMTTHGEERAEYIRLMGPTLGQVSHELRGEYWLLAQKWREYKDLFDEGEEQAVLLNTVASNFFGFLKFVVRGRYAAFASAAR